GASERVGESRVGRGSAELELATGLGLGAEPLDVPREELLAGLDGDLAVHLVLDPREPRHRAGRGAVEELDDEVGRVGLDDGADLAGAELAEGLPDGGGGAVQAALRDVGPREAE